MYYLTNFYFFTPINDVDSLAQEICKLEPSQQLSGLVILAPEGINGTLAATSSELRDQIKAWIQNRLNIPEAQFKDSASDRRPFRHGIKTRVRDEIVTLNRPDIVPTQLDESYLTPAQWHEWLNKGTGYHLVDTRNSYEYAIGTFDGAIDPKIDQFTQLSEVIEKKLSLDKEEPLLIFCTGGIRCEKAAIELRQQGFKKVYQLHGGILRYLEQFPNQHFKGECFVFDDRVAVDQNLNASKKYKLCPLCGDPAATVITCAFCGGPGQLCADCGKDPAKATCSQNCAHHFSLGRVSKKMSQRVPTAKPLAATHSLKS